ncbi:MAG: hypothetical protein R6U02_01460 [Alkalibacterium sp.]|uniref:hypothetical protein n=1 Tax=Alkalibacterium sp. TaxID=1872447 RepID=UPI003970A2BF
MDEICIIGDIQLVDGAFVVQLMKYPNDPRLTTPSMLDNVLLYLCAYAVRNYYELLGIPEKIH